MQRVNRSSAVLSLPAAPAGGTPGYFTGGNPGLGQQATVPGYEWFNGVQEELIGMLTRAGVTPAQADVTQLRQSLDRLYGGALRSVAANITLTADDAGLVMVDAAGGSRTITLPAANAASGRPLRFSFVRTDTSANTVTIQRAGTDLIEGATTFSLGVANRLNLMSDGVSAWRMMGEGATGRSYNTSGWQRLPGGLILQWGTVVTNAGGSLNVTFPIAFPNAAWGFTLGSGVTGPQFHNASSLLATGFVLQSWTSNTGAASGGLTAHYLAFGV